LKESLLKVANSAKNNIIKMIQRIIRTKGAELAIYDYGFKASTDAAVGMTSTSSINRTPVLFSHPTGFHGRVFDQCKWFNMSVFAYI